MSITKPLHRLPSIQSRVLAELLYYRYILSKAEDKSVLTLLLDYEIREKIATNLGVKRTSINTALSQLRRKKIIKNNKINEAYIPDIDEGKMSFTIAYEFNIKSEESRDDKTKNGKEATPDS